MCVNYKELKKRVQIHHTVLPNQEDIRNKVAKGKFVNVYDMKDTYHLIPIRAEDQYKTAFSTPFGVYRVSLNDSGWRLRRLFFNHIFLQAYPYPNANIKSYMDDIYTIHNIQEETQVSHKPFKQYMATQHTPIQPSESRIGVQHAKVLGLDVDLTQHTHDTAQKSIFRKFASTKPINQ